MDLAFNEQLVRVQVEAEHAVEALRVAANVLLAGGYVHPSYESAIIAREEQYPTGLPTFPVGVAIPHTDIEHVKQPAVAVLTFEQPIPFRTMGNPEEQVAVKVIFALAITDHQEQINMLQQLTEIFQDATLLKAISEAADVKEVVRELTASIHHA